MLVSGSLTFRPRWRAEAYPVVPGSTKSGMPVQGLLRIRIPILAKG